MIRRRFIASSESSWQIVSSVSFALESSPDPFVKAWVEVYLARLADAAGDRAEAVKHYKLALAVEGGSAKAKEAAEKGMQQSFRK